MKRVCAVLLAAGESRRMGALNKLALDVDGEPLVRRTARTLLESGIVEVVAVLGHEAERVGELLAGLAVRRMVNPDYAQGRTTSVRRGLAALGTQCDGVLMALADHALLTPADITALLRAFEDLDDNQALVPRHRGRRGNPVILACRHRQAILAGAPDLSARRFLDRHPELVTFFEMATDHVVFDLDTPADYAEVQRRLAPAPARRQATEA